MKKSKYNVAVEYNNHWLIYNLLKATCIILNQEEFERFQRYEKFDGSDQLCDLGFYIDDHYAEIDEVFYYIQRNTDQRNQNFRKHRIYTTLACNAHCPYCFEKGSGCDAMSLDTARKVVQYIIKKQERAKKLVITWFGGEPLLNTKVIDFISRELRSELPSDVEYTSFMITNGLLFDRNIVAMAVQDWKLEGVQITLDGLKQTYEKVKGFTVENAFEKVIANIHLLLYAGVKPSIRINYDQNNFEEVLRLVDYLGENFDGNDDIHVYAYKIMSDDSPDNSKSASADYDILIWDRILENGFCKDILQSIKSNMISCTAGSLYNEMFLPNGDIGKCAQAIADGDIVGNIDTGVRNAKVARWCCGRLNESCLQCTFLPICGGGCMYEFFHEKKGCSVSQKMVEYKLLQYLKQTIDGCNKA